MKIACFEIQSQKSIKKAIDHLTVKYMSPKRHDQPTSPMAHLAVSCGPIVHFFKIVPNQELRFISTSEASSNTRFRREVFKIIISKTQSKERQSRQEPKFRFEELDGHNFSKQTPSVDSVEHLKFVGSQLLAISDRQSAQMAVWNAARQGTFVVFCKILVE